MSAADRIYAIADGVPMTGAAFVAWVFEQREQRVSCTDIGARCGKAKRTIENLLARMRKKQRLGQPMTPAGYAGLTPETKRAVLEMAETGATHKEIAAALGISKSGVGRIIYAARLHIVPAPRAPGQTTIDRITRQNQCIFQMRVKGVSNGDIAEAIGISHASVRERITRMRKRGLDIPYYPSGLRHILTDAEKAAALEMINQAVPRREVAEKMGVSRGTVNNVVWQHETQAAQPAARPLWTPGPERYARMLHRQRMGIAHIAEELRDAYPDRAWTPVAVADFLYGREEIAA